MTPAPAGGGRPERRPVEPAQPAEPTARLREERLREERLRTVTRLERLLGEHDGFVAASRDSNADDEHDPEGATIAFERSQVDALARQVREHLREVDAALDRLARGTYGRCERCSGAVDPDRLEARPTARTCVTCPTAQSDTTA